MNRALFSGVAGLKTHQTKMDVIGNNIANVNTYGYKSQRAVFSDLYYQAIRNASAGTANQGGQNPSAVGYGSQLAGIQTQMSQSSMQTTGYGLDVAITGEGFLQVMDPAGNIFYTKAGMLDYDANGYLTDINGNFVLGTTATGVADTQKICLSNIGTVNPKKSSVTESINGVDYTITASNPNKFGNVAISITSSEGLPDGLPAKAIISSTGAISIELNAYHKFSSMNELNEAINDAITEANGGVQHAAGTFTLTATKNMFGSEAVDGTFTGTAVSEPASITLSDAAFGGKLTVSDFNPEGAATVITDGSQVTFTTVALPNTSPAQYEITANVNGIDYKGTVTGTSIYPVTLKSAGGGTIELNTKLGQTFTETDLQKACAEPAIGTASAPAFFLGGAQITGMSEEFANAGAMEFIIENLDASKHTFDLSVVISGVTYQAQTQATPGGEVTLFPVAQGSLMGAAVDEGFFGGTMKFVSTSAEFAGKGTITPENFKATYVDNGAGNSAWNITLSIGGVDYTGTISENSTDSTLNLVGPEGQYVQVTNPGFAGMTDYYTNKQVPAAAPTNGASINAFDSGSIQASPAGIRTDGEEGSITLSIPTLITMAENYGLNMNSANFHTSLNDLLLGSVGLHNYAAVGSKDAITEPLTGAEIAGTDFSVTTGQMTGAVEDGFFGGGMLFMQTSTDFKGNGTITPDKFTAEYVAGVDDGNSYWTVTLDIDGTKYTTTISEGTIASSLLLKGPEGDYIQVTNPGFEGMNDYFRSQQNPPRDPATGDSVQALNGNDTITITPSVPSKEMGLSSKPFTLSGGTDGGAVTLDQISSIAIASDGTITVSHDELGNVVAGRISLASFANPSGLLLQGTNYFAATANSGEPNLCDPGSDGTGSLVTSALEMSNVDIAAEMADMITTQRGFQANSRIITVSDSMLEELINLKR